MTTLHDIHTCPMLNSPWALAHDPLGRLVLVLPRPMPAADIANLVADLLRPADSWYAEPPVADPASPLPQPRKPNEPTTHDNSPHTALLGIIDVS